MRRPGRKGQRWRQLERVPAELPAHLGGDLETWLLEGSQGQGGSPGLGD